jgi:hypothetical protein
MAILKKYSKGRVTDTAKVKADSETPTARFKVIPKSENGKAYKDASKLVENKSKNSKGDKHNGTTL